VIWTLVQHIFIASCRYCKFRQLTPACYVNYFKTKLFIKLPLVRFVAMDSPRKSKLKTINVGSRNSQLALIQTNIVIQQLKQFYDNNQCDSTSSNRSDEYVFNIVSMTTTGDQILDKALPDIGSKSLFTKELEIALLERRVDFIVHSLKDLPTKLPEGCAIGAIGKRDDPDDCIVVKNSLRSFIKPLDIIFDHSRLPTQEGKRYRIGTSSQRRIAMLRCCNKQLECVNIRGNLNTRLSKLDKDDDEYAAIILAKAGLKRMEWSERMSETLTPESDPRLSHWCYAVGQGALAIECRADDNFILDLISPIVDLKTTYEAIAERSLMRRLEGGCSVPLGVRSTWLGAQKTTLMLDGIILSIDGEHIVQAQSQTQLDEPNDNYQIIRESDVIETTGIVLPDRLSNRMTASNFEKCAKLGVKVANKMIDLGCLELMRRNKE
jgi:hydroxymethylbilane synthase